MPNTAPATTLRGDFVERFGRDGYVLLPERPVVRDGETYFIMSSLAAHIEQFAVGRHTAPARQVAVQRTLSADKIDDAGHFPLANPYEVTGSFFRFCDRAPDAALAVTFGLLRDLIGLGPEALYYRTTDRLGLDLALCRMGARANNVIVWPSLKPLSLGQGRASGEYIYLYAPYRHGVVPVAVLGFIPLPNGLAVDSAFFLERLAMMVEDQPFPFSTSLFSDLTAAVWDCADLAGCRQRDGYVWVYAMRALVALLWDGAQVGSRYSGHSVKKFVRRLGYSLGGSTLSLATLRDLTAAAGRGLSELGYDLAGGEAAIAQTLQAAINGASAQISRELRRLARSIEGAECNEADVARWEQERGLRREWIADLLLERGRALPFPLKKRRCSIKHDGYPFETAAPVDVLGILYRAEMGYQTNRATQLLPS